MRKISLPKERLYEYFSTHTVATLDELKIALGSNTSMTIYRKLKELDYISSCSHCGRYYSLKQYAQFDFLGLWYFNNILFSSHGNLENTLEELINRSPAGYSASELENMLMLKPNASLIKLYNQKHIIRKKLAGFYVYFSKAPRVRTLQEIERKESGKIQASMNLNSDILMNELKAAIIIFYSTLNEKQRRLYSGLESLKFGKNGDKIISDLLNINIKTVGKGRRELLSGCVDIDTIRSTGGGRKKNRGKNA